MPPGIKDDILAYYANLDLPFATKKKPELWAQVLKDLEVLKTMPTSTEPIPFPTYADGSGDSGPIPGPSTLSSPNPLP